MIQEIPVFPKDLMAHLNIKGHALTRLIADRKVPEFDVKLTQKTRYWHRSTLVQAGLFQDATQQAVSANNND